MDGSLVESITFLNNKNMKANFNVNAVDFSGDEILLNGKKVNLSEELQKSLFFAGNNTRLTPEEKYLAYKVGRKLASGSDEYTAEECSFIKKIAGDTMAAGLYGSIVDIIEGESNK